MVIITITYPIISSSASSSSSSSSSSATTTSYYIHEKNINIFYITLLSLFSTFFGHVLFCGRLYQEQTTRAAKITIILIIMLLLRLLQCCCFCCCGDSVCSLLLDFVCFARLRLFVLSGAAFQEKKKRGDDEQQHFCVWCSSCS